MNTRQHTEIPIGTDHPRFVLHHNPGTDGTPRAQLLRSYLEWLSDPAARSEAAATADIVESLPAVPIVVRLHAVATLPHGHIGAFRMGSAASPARRWEVRIAYGPDFPDPTMGWSWIATIPHELVHLREFHRRQGGRLPCELDVATFKGDWTHPGKDAEEGMAEELGEQAGVWEFAAENRALFDDPALLHGWKRLQRVGGPHRSR